MRFALLALVAATATANAAPPERPWADGVPEVQQAWARRLFDDGNLLFEEEKYAQALAIYREAVKIWDHPAIRYNMAVANIHLDRPLAAHEDLARALRFGASPLQGDAYAQAQTYEKLLLGQLAQLKVVCRQPGAAVFVDGEQVFVAPGDGLRVLLPGKHQLVASATGFSTATRAVELVAGARVEEELAPVAIPLPVTTAVATERRWPTWTPWAVVGGGAALALGGIPFQLAASDNLDRYDQAVASACPSGCSRASLPAATRDLESRAHVENGLAIGLFAAGGAVVGGIVMLLMNQPHPVPPDHLAVVPETGPGRVGAALAGRF